jgi:hypothetical protein
MFGSQILEVAIGVIFIFILTSIICSVVREGIEAWMKTRAAFLERGIRELLHDKEGTGLAKDFYQHPLIYSLFAAEYQPLTAGNKKPWAWTKGRELPSYIPTKNFALALMDMAARGPQTDAPNSDAESTRISLEAIRRNVGNLENPAVQRVVLAALDTAQGDLNQLQANLEAWYDSGMDRVSGWYKRSSQWVIFWIALFVSITLNINTITIADYLSRNDVARKALVARAEAAVNDPAFQSAVKSSRDSAAARYYDARRELDSLELPIGWSRGWGAPRQHLRRSTTKLPAADNSQAQPGNAKAENEGIEIWNDVFGPVFGWLLTALAAMLGAPFWFDVLNKVMVIRSTVKPHEKSPEEASEDRQPSAPPGGGGAGNNPQNPPPGGSGAGTNPPPAPAPATPAPPATEHNPDGCDVEANPDDYTTDEDLPAATGGVQPQPRLAPAANAQ